MGVQTGLNLDALIEAGKIAEEVVGRPLPGKVHGAGVHRPRMSLMPPALSAR